MRLNITALAAAVSLALVATPGAARAQSWQCAPFARMFSGLQLFGAAASWWGQAVGRYAQGSVPKPGSVLVFKALSSMRSGHVATVTKILSDRMIKVTHANWSIIDGHRGQIERDVTVVDSSPNNDWTQVRVWYAPIQKVGTKAFPVYGFIYDGKAAVAKVAEAARDAVIDVKAAATTMKAAASTGMKDVAAKVADAS